MKNAILFFAGVVLLSLATTTKAQVATNYAFSQDTVTYTAITGGTILQGTPPPPNNPFSHYNDLDIGFTFRFNEIDYNSFSVCGKGFIALGSPFSDNYNGPLSSGPNNNVISAFSTSNELQGTDGSELRYQILGTSPNQILVIQWTKYWTRNTIPESSYDFQIRLYETTNAIEIVYGTMISTGDIGTNGTNVQVGLRGYSPNDFNNRKTTASWSNTTAGDANTSTCAISATNTPVSGLTFAWKPKVMPFTFSSFTTKQADTLDVCRGSLSPIISFQIAMSGNSGTPLSLDSVMLNDSGTTNFVRDIKNVKIYSTGTKSTFDTTTLYGSAPNVSSPIPGKVMLIGGGNPNYFWVTYDIATKAIAGDLVDAQCTSVSLSGSVGIKTPLVSNPAGERIISQWHSKENLEMKGLGIGFSIGNKGYIYFGNVNGNSSELWRYDPDSNKWTQMNSFPGVIRQGAVGFSIGGKGYVGLGMGSASSYLTDFWEYDPQNDSWRGVAPFLGQGRYLAVGFVIGGKGYVGTGASYSGSAWTYYKDFYEYTPSTDSTPDAWKKITEVPGQYAGRRGAVSFSIGGKGYVGWGIAPVFNDTTFYEYTPGTDEWVQVASYPSNSMKMGISFSIGQNGYVGGIDKGNKGQARFWKYDPTITDTSNTGEWIEINNLPEIPRNGENAVGFSINGIGYVLFGRWSYSIDRSGFWSYKPFPHAAFSSSVDTICSGESIMFSDQSTESPTSWNWSFPGGTPSSSTAQKPTITYNIAGTHSVTLIVENEGGADTLIRVNSITVKQSPKASAGDDVTLCFGSSTKLSASGGGNYSWSPSSGLSCTDCSNPDAKPDTTTTYIVRVTNDNGCSDVDTVTVTVTNVLVAEAGANVSVCEGESTQLHASGGTTYRWYPSEHLSDSLVREPIASPLITTTYSVIVSGGSCPSDTDSVTVTVHKNPSAPNITQNGNTLTSSPATKYIWYRNDTLIVNATSQTYTAIQNGKYTVKITDSNGCSSISAYKQVTVGVDDGKVQPDHFMLEQNYPNPFTQLSVVSYQLSGKGLFEVRDMLGRTMYHLAIDSNTKQITIDANTLPNGLYMYSLNDGKNIQSRTMMVMK